MTFVRWLSAELAELCSALGWNLWEMERQDNTQWVDFLSTSWKGLGLGLCSSPPVPIYDNLLTPNMTYSSLLFAFVHSFHSLRINTVFLFCIMVQNSSHIVAV